MIQDNEQILPPAKIPERESARPAESVESASVAATADDTPPRGRGRWIMAAIAALGVALFAVPLIRGPERSSRATSAASGGTPVPEGAATCSEAKGRANFDFTLKDVNGGTVRLSDYKGKVILLNFWATWCGPCKLEIPALVEAYQEHRDRGFVVLGVLSEDDPSPDDLRGFMGAFRMNYPVFRENADLGDAFGPLWALPTSFVIDRHGSICTKHMGAVSREMVEREIKGLL